MNSNYFKFIVFVSFVCVSYCLNLCNPQELAGNNVTFYKYTQVTSQPCCDKSLCIRKCCALGFYLERGRCSANPNITFTVPLYQDDNLIRNVTPRSLIIGAMKQCDFHPLRPFLEPEEQFYLQENSTLWVPAENLLLNNSEFCIDYTGEDFDLMALKCFSERPEDPMQMQVSRKLNYIGMMISMPFLLATFLVYAILPDHNIHKKALMYYVMSLFMAYVFLVCIQLPTTEYSEASCTSLGVFCIFFFLLSFFWMNVICVDMFLGFRGFRGFSGNKSSEKKRFIWYNVYAWGMSLTITIVIIIINQAGNPDKWFHPNLGIGQCYIRDGLPLLIYFYMPMGLLITVNLALFIFTALKIRQVKKETKVLRKGDSKRHSDDNDKQKFNLYLKLLFAMGVNWSMEIVSWAVSYKYQQSIPSYVWYLTDFCNASYGVFIFFIFVFKKSVWKQLQRRYYAFRGKQHLAHSMTTTNQTASSAVDTNRNSDDQEMALSSTR